MSLDQGLKRREASCRGALECGLDNPPKSMVLSVEPFRSPIMNRLIFTLPLALFPSVLPAADARFDRCHAMSMNDLRLTCYDKETGYVEPQPDEQEKVANKEQKVEPEEKPLGKQWRYRDEVSALDDRTDVWLSLSSKNTEGNAIGSPTRATLWVRCMENKTNVFIGFGRYTTDNQSVKYKLDDGPVQKQWMETMRGGEGIGIWSGSRAIPFIKRTFGKQRLVISYNTYTGPVEFKFDISGLRERIDPLATACHWKP